jgi:hypothetical protein
MRLLCACSVLFIAAASGSAQIAVPASLQSLAFLQGVWIANDGAQQAETTEFHWQERQGNTVLVGRHWAGDAGECPWCVTQATMVAYYDTASKQVRVHFHDKTQRVMDFRLASAREKSVQFSTVVESGLPTYRLTFKLLPRDVLSLTLEEAESGRESAFTTGARWSFHRQLLLAP